VIQLTSYVSGKLKTLQKSQGISLMNILYGSRVSITTALRLLIHDTINQGVSENKKLPKLRKNNIIKRKPKGEKT